jgi:maltose O-acetyltransferase
MSSQRELMLAGEPYVASDPELVALHLAAMRLQERYNATSVDDGDERDRLLRDWFGSVGPETRLRPPVYVDYGVHITWGARGFANFGLVALDCARITIGDDVQVGPNVQLLTPTHPVDPALRRSGIEGAGPITIGDNVWLGGGVIVLAGVTIGDNSVVGAGSVVTKDVPADVVVVGNPARVIRRL